MAKDRSAANIAGLAALGALGYQLLKNKKGDTASGTQSASNVESAQPPVSEDQRKRAVEEGSNASALDSINDYYANRKPVDSGDANVAAAVQNAPRVTPVEAATPKAANPSRSYKSASSDDSQAMPAPKGGSGGGRGPAFGEREAYEATRYKPRYTPPGQAPKISAGARYPMTSLTREDVLKATEMKKGGAVKKMASGGVTRSSASKRADGIAQKGKTRGTMVMCGGGRTKK